MDSRGAIREGRDCRRFARPAEGKGFVQGPRRHAGAVFSRSADPVTPARLLLYLLDAHGANALLGRCGDLVIDHLGRQREPAGGEGQRITVQLQRLGGDVAEVVAFVVIARIERLAGCAAVTLRLLLGLDVLGTGEQTAEGDAVLEELRVVGAEVDLGAF